MLSLLLAAGAAAAPAASAHEGVETVDGHAAEDAVVHTAAQERALDAHTRSSRPRTRAPRPRR